MATTRDWGHYREMWIRVLKKQTGKDLDYWNALIKKKKFADRQQLREWLAGEGVTGYAEQLLSMEYFGYPDWMTSSADDLIDGQYADRPQLRPIYEAIVASAQSFGELVIQARKGYVSLMTPKRTFAARAPYDQEPARPRPEDRGIETAWPTQTISDSRDDAD